MNKITNNKGVITTSSITPGPLVDEEIKEANRALKEQRDLLEVSPIDVTLNAVVYKFDADEKSLKRIRQAIVHFDDVQALDTSAPEGKITWVLADNSTLQVTSMDLLEVEHAVALRSLMLHAQYQADKM